MAVAKARRKLRGSDPKDAKVKKAKILIFGQAGVGKTWFSLSFPDAYYIDCEGGATRERYTSKLKEAGASYLGQEDGAGDFATVLEEVQTLAMTEHDRKTLIIDSFTKLFNNSIAAEEERLADAGEKVAFGNEKKPSVKMSRRLVSWLDRIDMNVILLCHEKAKWQGGEQTGFTYDGWDKLEYELDLTLHVQKKVKRSAIVKKSRLENFPDGSNFDLTYEEFAHRYGRKAIEGEVKTLTPSTDDQVSTLLQLIDEKSADSKQQSKWKEKAGVDNWSDMDFETIQKCIDYLSKKVAG